MVGRPEVLRHGHFRLVSGLHSDTFVRFSKLAEDADALAYVADLLAAIVANWQPDAILAPSTAGVSLGVVLGRRLGIRLHLSNVGDDGRATKVIGTMPAEGSRLLIVNDVISTGEGVKALARVATSAGAVPVGCCAFIARTPGEPAEAVGMPVAVTACADLGAWAADDCSLCEAGLPPEDARDLN
jgi:orotate phosphoribosyltransferase